MGCVGVSWDYLGLPLGLFWMYFRLHFEQNSMNVGLEMEIVHLVKTSKKPRLLLAFLRFRDNELYKKWSKGGQEDIFSLKFDET